MKKITTEGLITTIPGLAPKATHDADYNAPLRAGFAYLVRSEVTMLELYPLLGELLFCSRVADETGKPGSSPNVVGLFVDDVAENLFGSLIPDPSPWENPTKKLAPSLGESKPPFSAWLDTYSTHVANPDLHAHESTNDDKWQVQSLAGPGNPMDAFRFIKRVGEEKSVGILNLYLLNSLSNLYRNLGLAETAALLKASLGQTIWPPEPGGGESTNGSNGGGSVSDEDYLKRRESLFFAVLQEGVMREEERSYLESFFDGVIEIKPAWQKTVDGDWLRLPCYRALSLPETRTFLPPYVYLPRDARTRDFTLWENSGDKKRLVFSKGKTTRFIDALLMSPNMKCGRTPPQDT